MELWEKILQLALLGSERTHLEPDLKEALRQYRIDPEDPLPQVILSGAAALHQVRRLQIPAQAFDRPLPEPVVEEEDHQELPPRSIQFLKQILSGRFRRALPEYVQLLVDQRFLLPPEFLPDLLDQCLQDAVLWKELQPLLGGRADWLIALHPQWRMLAPRGDASRWPEAMHEERQLILIYLRKRNPELAVPLLKSTWEASDYRKKLTYLGWMKIGLSPTDEPFLENARRDKRKEVRMKAADLLATIPGSALTKRIFATLKPLINFDQEKGRLEVALPKDIPVGTAEDGVQPDVKKGTSGGLKVSWLQECISRIPAAYWLEYFDCERAELLRYFDTSSRADLLLSALGDAILRFGDQQLATELIHHLLLKNSDVPKAMDWKAMVALIPATTFQELTTNALQHQAGLLEERQLLSGMLELGWHPWNESMSRQIINGLKQWMAESKTFLWNLWHYKRLLETAAYCSPLILMNELAADWPMQSPVWNQWAPDVERLLRIMQFRKEMKLIT